MKILGIDFGKRRIGLALSDDYGWSAQGLTTITRINTETDLSRIKEIIALYRVEEVLVGLPRNLNGTMGPQTQEVMSFVNQLRKNLNLPVVTWDERLSSVAAEKILLEADVSRKKRKKVIDKLAAAIFLQSYLESKRKKIVDFEE
jgi:putative Holliday junction resolvase